MRKNLGKKIMALCLSGMMLISLAGCSKKTAPQTENTKEPTPTTATTEPGKPDAVQELNMVFDDLATLDVNDVRNSNEFQVLSQIQEGLFRIFTDESGNATMENAGCETYEVSEDGLVYTFHLRDSLWSDGEKVTAQHYVDSIKRLLNPELAFSYSFMAYDIKNAQKYYDGEATADEIGVKAIDDSTLEITLEAAIPFFAKKLANVCFSPVRLDVIEAGGENWATEYTKQVYNGPFVIESRILNNEMILAKNEKYWDAKNVHLTKVTLKQVAEAATQSLLLESKELDFVAANTDYINKWKGMVDSGLLVQRNVVSPANTYMIFNQHTGGSSGLMNNPNIRQALSLSINREEMNELIYNGQNTPAYGLIPFNMMSGDVEFRSISEEPLKALKAEYDTTEKVVELFKKGLAEENVSTDDLSKITLTILTTASTSQNENIMEYFKQTWENNLGVTINVNMCADTSLFVTERNANNYDMVLMGWNGDYDDPMTFMELWNTGSGYAKFMGGYSNAEFDTMFDSLAKISDTKERTDIYVKMENNLVAENAGMAPIYYGNSEFFVQNYVKNLSTPNFGPAIEFSRAYISGKEQ